MVMYLLDEVSFYLLMIIPFLVPISVFAALWIFWLPRQAKTIIKAKLKRKALELVADDAGNVDYLLRDVESEGQLISEVKKMGMKYHDVKIIPKRSHPIITKPFFLKGEGIPHFISYAGKAIATNPLVLAFIELFENGKEVIDKLKKGEHIELDPRKLGEYYNQTYDEGQYQIMLDKMYQRGREERTSSKLFIPIAIIIVLGIIAVLVLPNLMGGGSTFI